MRARSFALERRNRVMVELARRFAMAGTPLVLLDGCSADM